MNGVQKIFILALFSTIIFSCTTQNKLNRPEVKSLKFISEYTLPYRLQFNGTTVGGLSSIDYSPKEKLYYFISDDRSDTNAARFYTAKISLSEKGIAAVQITAVNTLLQKDGVPYHNRKQNPLNVPDPEAMRYHPLTKTFVWSSEGERTLRKNTEVLTDPSITIMNKNGQWTDSFALPQNMRMTASETGPRNNGVFEGLAFSADFKWLYVSVEEPLYVDGPRAGLFDSSAWVRIIKFDMNTRQPVAQYAYQVDPVVQEPISEGTFAVNGITDILTVNENQLLVTERSYSTGRLGNNIRVYSVNLSEAEDISSNTSLAKKPTQKPLQKKLVLNMDNLRRLVDNVEGATFGPKLSNGKASLIFVTDNNFSSSQKTQLLLFEVE